jgi:hypothetical protein
MLFCGSKYPPLAKNARNGAHGISRFGRKFA